MSSNSAASNIETKEPQQNQSAAEVTVALTRRMALYCPDLDSVGRMFLAYFIEGTSGGKEPTEEFEAFLAKSAKSSIRQLGLPLTAEILVTITQQGVKITVNLDLSPSIMARSPSEMVH